MITSSLVNPLDVALRVPAEPQLPQQRGVRRPELLGAGQDLLVSGVAGGQRPHGQHHSLVMTLISSDTREGV